MDVRTPLKKRSASVLALIALTIFLFLTGTKLTHAAFGVSPPYLNADHLVPGVVYTQTIYLVQDQPNADLPIKATLTIPAPADTWVTLNTGFNFVIPAGTHQFPVTISIQVPQGQSLGKYDGDIAFTSEPSQAGQVTIALGVDVAVNLTVGSGIFEQYSVPRINFLDIEEGWNPEVNVTFENDGNIPEGFDSASFDLYDQYDAVRLAYITKDSGFPITPPFTTQSYTVQFPTDFHLGIGQYWGVVTFYKNQQVVATQKAIFNVLKAGSISGTWGIIEHFISSNQWIIYVAIILVLGIIILIVWGVRKRRRHSK